MEDYTTIKKLKKDTKKNTLVIILARVMNSIFITFCILITLTIGVVSYKVIPMLVESQKNAIKTVNKSTPDTFNKVGTTFIYDSNKKEIAKLTSSKDIIYLRYNKIPANVKNAFIAVEDRRFFQHNGIDYKGLARVLIDAAKTNGEEVHGASTITQQLARNIFLNMDVNLNRKINEAFIASELERKYTKEEILEYYINNIYFANRYYGIGAAAKGYFNKSVDKLSLSQIAFLCAIPNRPALYNPFTGAEHTIKRRDKILGDMLEQGYITEKDYKKAIKEKIKVKKKKIDLNDYETTYAINCAVKYFMEKNGFNFRYSFSTMEDYQKYNEEFKKSYDKEKEKLYSSGYKIYTYLDNDIQEDIQKAIDSTLKFDKSKQSNGIYALQGACTVINNKNGKVVAIVGGRSQKLDTYTLNRAFQSHRQPGSTIKPLIDYAPALEKGYTSSSIVDDTYFDGGPHNSGSYSGKITLREALTFSKNVVAWKLFTEITPQKALSYVQDMNFSKIVPSDYYPPISLGGMTYGVTTVEMASAYSALVNDGIYRNTDCIKSIIDREGNNVYKRKKDKKIYSETTARQIISMLQDVIKVGTGKSIGWSSDIEAAGKTGTTNGSKDGWFCGVTPYYSIAVWVGYDNPKTLNNLWGATYPAEIWKKSMLSCISDKKAKSFMKESSNKSYKESSQFDWLKGRDDKEEISPGYTVGNYKTDHTLADEADNIINKINATKDSEKAEILLSELKDTVSKIYGQTLKRKYSNKVKDTESSVSSLKQKKVLKVNVIREEIKDDLSNEIPEDNVSTASENNEVEYMSSDTEELEEGHLNNKDEIESNDYIESDLADDSLDDLAGDSLDDSNEENINYFE